MTLQPKQYTAAKWTNDYQPILIPDVNSIAGDSEHINDDVNNTSTSNDSVEISGVAKALDTMEDIVLNLNEF